MYKEYEIIINIIGTIVIPYLSYKLTKKAMNYNNENIKIKKEELKYKNSIKYTNLILNTFENMIRINHEINVPSLNYIKDSLDYFYCLNNNKIDKLGLDHHLYEGISSIYNDNFKNEENEFICYYKIPYQYKYLLFPSDFNENVDFVKCKIKIAYENLSDQQIIGIYLYSKERYDKLSRVLFQHSKYLQSTLNEIRRSLHFIKYNNSLDIPEKIIYDLKVLQNALDNILELINWEFENYTKVVDNYTISIIFSSILNIYLLNKILNKICYQNNIFDTQ